MASLSPTPSVWVQVDGESKPSHKNTQSLEIQHSSVSAGIHDGGPSDRAAGAGVASDQKVLEKPHTTDAVGTRSARSSSNSEASGSMRFADDLTSLQSIEHLRAFHARAREAFQHERKGYCKGGNILCKLYNIWMPVRFESPAIENQYLIWSSGARWAAECTSVALLFIMVILFVLDTAKNVVNYPVATICVFIALFGLLFASYVFIVHQHRLPVRLQMVRLQLVSIFAVLMCAGMLLAGATCKPWLSLNPCISYTSHALNGNQVTQLFVMEIVLGMGYATQLCWLTAANLLFLCMNLWIMIRFQVVFGSFFLMIIVSVVFAALISFQAYANHVSRRFEFHMLHRMARQIRTIHEHSRALASAQEATMMERSNAVKANTARETHQAIMGYTCHELRNPLHAIRGCLDELLQRIAPGHVADEGDVNNLRNIESAYNQMNQVTDDVLDFNKLQSGRLKLRCQSLNIRELLQRIALQYGNELAHPIVVQVAPNVPQVVEADGVRLTQIITNGLTNAMKHMLAGTAITLACTFDDDSSTTGRHMVTVEVRDVGVGLRGLDTSKLFQPYERGLDDDTGLKGSGLGLPISRMLVSMMGGDIGLEDRGDCTVYWFRIPAARRHGMDSSTALQVAPVRLLVPETPSASREDMVPLLSPLPTATDSIVLDMPHIGGGAGQDCAADQNSIAHTSTSTDALLEAVTSDQPWLYWGSRVPTPVPQRPLRCLVVDDQAINRRLLAGMLRRLGHVPFELADGDEVLPAFSTLQLPPDVIFLDIYMVRSDGRDTAKQLRAAGIGLPLIAATGNIAATDVLGYRDVGFDGVLGKPFSVSHVGALLNAVLKPV